MLKRGLRYIFLLTLFVTSQMQAGFLSGFEKGLFRSLCAGIVTMQVMSFASKESKFEAGLFVAGAAALYGIYNGAVQYTSNFLEGRPSSVNNNALGEVTGSLGCFLGGLAILSCDLLPTSAYLKKA